jgi:hypothetical protein
LPLPAIRLAVGILGSYKDCRALGWDCSLQGRERGFSLEEFLMNVVGISIFNGNP